MTDLGSRELDPSFDVIDFLAVGDAADLSTCDREPIHLSGAIQPHGCLLAVGPDFTVVQVSANCFEYLGLAVADVLGASLTTALGEELTHRLMAVLGDSRTSGLDPLICRLRNEATYDLTWHRIGGFTVIELEPSVVGGAVASMTALFGDVRNAMHCLEDADGLERLCAVAAAEFKRLTGYDRVMVYQFGKDEHGEVVAEERELELEPFLGLNYPASDIPRQARKLYLLNQLRVIADVNYVPVPLLGDPALADSTPLNLSLSSLRSVSPFHLSYLSEMGVRATMTVSLMHGTKLWGMLACHHRSPKRINAQLQAGCRILGQVFSMQIVAQEERERHLYRAQLAKIEVHLVSRMSGAASFAGALASSVPSPLALTAADGMVARIEGQTVSVGVVPPPEAIELLLVQLRMPEETAPLESENVSQLFPELAGYTRQASGVLAVPLSGGYDDFVLWFRGELIRHVDWAGGPTKPATSALSPQRSFQIWSEEVRGHSLPWREAEVDAAQGFAKALPELTLARTRDRLAHLAMHDALTGLPNRTLLLDRTAVALARQRRAGGEVALLFIDLDRFKLVNDSLGHAAGDDLLRHAANRLAGVIRAGDTVARIGGDEFVVLCEAMISTGASQLAERIVQAFRTPFRLELGDAVVTASVGVAVAENAGTPAELLHDADTAMYRTKHAGRDAFFSFTAEMRAISLRRVEIEAKLGPALANRELCLYFQPIHTSAGILTGFEALSRWPLEGRGMVLPAEFIPVAESAGLMGSLTYWALDEGLAALARWRAHRPELNLSLAVNLSSTQLDEDDLAQMLARLLREHDIPAEALCLEMPEGAFLGDESDGQQFTQFMRERGLRLSIDDFGVGGMSLSSVSKLAVHELKIDRRFVSDLDSNQAYVAVVASVVALAHQLGLQALAKGVETDDQLAMVRRLGCDAVQGYLLGRPMPSAEVDRLLG